MNFILILLIHVIGHTVAIESRSLNLALDTVLEFNNKDNTDLLIINNVQEFLEKIIKVLKYKNGRRSMNKDYKFTDFLIKFFEIINSYDDDDLEDVVTVIDDEIRKYHYAGCRFFELLQNNDMRKFVSRTLNKLKDKTPDDMRECVKNIINILRTQQNRDVKEFLKYINTLYPKDSKVKLKRILNNIELYKSKSKRANLDLIKLIRNGLRNAIFDHYTNLNVNARKDFKIRLETFWKNFMDPLKVEHNVWNLRYTKIGKRGRDDTSNTASIINWEFHDQTTNLYKQKYIDIFNLNTLNYFDRNVDFTTKPTKLEKFYSKTEFKADLLDITEITAKAKEKRSNLNVFSTIKDESSQINIVPIKDKEIKPIDRNILGHFKDEVTSKNLVKEFEKTFDLNLPDISTMVKEKFDSITKEKLLNTKREKLEDIKVNIAETTNTPAEKVKKRTKLQDKIKHKKPKRFSVVTENLIKPDTFYDSEEIYNINDRKRTKTTQKHNSKTPTKRKHKNTKRTTRSRFMTLFVEGFTRKVKKSRTSDKTTAKHKQYTSWKEVKKHKEQQKSKRNKFTYADSDEYPKRTTKATDREHRHEKPTQNQKKHKTQQKYAKRPKKTTKKSRKWLKLPTTESVEGMSIESFEARSYRKNLDFDDFQNEVKKRQHILNITQSLTTPKTTADVETTLPIDITTFGSLHFWQGTTKIPISHDTTILSNFTKAAENNAINKTDVPKSAIGSLNFKNTKENYEEILKNKTIRLIDLDHVTIPKVLITTIIDTSGKEEENKTIIVKATKLTQKTKIIATKTPILKRRSIGVAKRNETNTKSKNTSTTNVTEATRNSTNFNITKPTFNLGDFFNQSEILNVGDKSRKDKIKENIMKDMEAVFSPTTSTTEVRNVFTDPFNEIENALDLD